MGHHGTIAVCVLNSDVDSIALCERAPVEPALASTSLRHRTTHLHFVPHGIDSLPFDAQLEAVEKLLHGQLPAFHRYRRLSPFNLMIEWWYDAELDVQLSARVLRTLATLRAGIDGDLGWIGDDLYCEKVDPRTPFFYGELAVKADGHHVISGRQGSVEFGRQVARAVRAMRAGGVIDFDVRGGVGSPSAHFSANAVRLAASAGASIRLRVRPLERSRAPWIGPAEGSAVAKSPL
ncbi:MAG: hypothetical protein AB7T37_16785 [Dehalococcoidia bacterium]